MLFYTLKKKCIYSSSNEVSSGVPQGSVLGSLLFVVYINNINTNLKNITVEKYANDIKLYLEIIGPGHNAAMDHGLTTQVGCGQV